MCLAKVYLNNSADEPILKDIAYMRLQDDCVELETLFGEAKIIPGRIAEINFATSKIFINEHYDTEEA